MLIAYLNEDSDAADVAHLVEEAGRRCVLVAGDLSDPAHCRAVIGRAANEFGGIDVLVSNAAYQMTHENLDEITDEEWDYTFLECRSLFSSRQGRGAAHERWGVRYRKLFGQLRYAVSDLGTLRRDEGGHRQSVREPGTVAGGEGHSG